MAKRGSNIYKRKDGRFEGRVSVGYKENGKTKYRYVYGHSLAEVKEKMAQVYSGKNTQEQSKNKMIVRDIAEQWLAEKKLTVKAASYTSYRNLLNNHIYPEFGGIRYTALTKQMLNRYMSELLVSGREDGSGGLSVKTVRDVIVVLKSVCSYAHNEYNFSNPAENIKLPRIEKNSDESNMKELNGTASAPPKKKTPSSKKKYAEAVTMTEEENQKLTGQHTTAFVEKCIEVLNNYKLSSGKRYKSDYHTILNWVIERVSKDYPQLDKPPAQSSAYDVNVNPFDQFVR